MLNEGGRPDFGSAGMSGAHPSSTPRQVPCAISAESVLDITGEGMGDARYGRYRFERGLTQLGYAAEFGEEPPFQQRPCPADIIKDG